MGNKPFLGFKESFRHREESPPRVMETLFYCPRKHIHRLRETGLWLRFYYLGKRVNDFTFLRKRENDFTIWVGRGYENTDSSMYCLCWLKKWPAAIRAVVRFVIIV